MVVVRFSMLPLIPGLPFQHPQREPLRQIGEDYGLSQGPHWERSKGISSAGWMEPTHLLCRITAGRAQSKPERLRPLRLSSSLESACRGSINSHIPPAEAYREEGDGAQLCGASEGQAHLCGSRELWERGLKLWLGCYCVKQKQVKTSKYSDVKSEFLFKLVFCSDSKYFTWSCFLQSFMSILELRKKKKHLIVNMG